MSKENPLPEKPKELSFREQRIRKITHLYYSKPEIQKAIFDFSVNREVCPRYFEGFGKRPDCFQYRADVFGMVKKGATSFHCSEEIWQDPLKITTGMSEADANELRAGWDLLIDIDSKYIDYSKISAQVIVKMLKFHGIQNIGVKFSGSKGFHILVPWKSFPKEINNIKTSDMFPEWPRIITQYIMEKTKTEITKKISETLENNNEHEFINKYIRGEKREKEVMEHVSPDIILVSPRHLFRVPYSLHEKTSLASAVINPDEIGNFELKHADPMKLFQGKEQIKNFLPDAVEGEAKELLVQALDWHKETCPEKDDKKYDKLDFKPIKLSNLSEENFPPCIKNILKGINDGRKRALFALINLFRSIGMEREELEKRIYDWNEKNPIPLKKGYLKSQLAWTYRKKPIMPPNCREFYQGIAVCIPSDFCKLIKNPVNYTVKKNFIANAPKRKLRRKKYK